MRNQPVKQHELTEHHREHLRRHHAAGMVLSEQAHKFLRGEQLTEQEHQDVCRFLSVISIARPPQGMA